MRERARTRRLRLGTTAIALSCWCALHPLASAARADDDWSLTRPEPREQRRRPSARAAVSIEAALASALARPLDPALLARLWAAYRQRDHDLSALERELTARSSGSDRAARAALLVLANLHIELGQPERARQAFARAADGGGTSDAAALEAWAQLEHQSGQLADERGLLERLLPLTAARQPRSELLARLGNLLLELGDPFAARERFAAAARANPGSVGHALAYARALAARGEHAAAAAAFAEVLPSLRGDARVLPPLWLELAQLQLSAAEVEAALASLRQAQRLIAANSGLGAQLREQLFEVQRRRGRLDEFAQELERAPRGDNAALLSRVYAELDRPQDSLAVLRSISARQPHDIASAERAIALLWQQGRVEDVITEYQRLVRVFPRETRFAVELSQLLFQAGRRAEARAALERLSRAAPRDVAVHEAVVDLYTRFGDAAAAHREVQLLARLEPNTPERFVTLGEAELARGRKDAARAAFARVANGRTSLPAQLRLSQVYLDHEFANEALAQYDKAEKLWPNAPAIARGRAEALTRLFRYKPAIEEWQRVLTLPGADARLRRDARKQIVALWDELSELKAHLVSLEGACRDWEGNTAQPNASSCDVDQARTLVEAYERMARHGGPRAEPAHYLRAAEELLQRIVRAEPNDPDSLLALERLRVKRGDLDAAIAALELLTRTDPTNAPVYLARMSGYALARYRDAAAIEYASRAVAAAPDDPSGHERLGDLYRARNDLKRALASYERALELDPQRFDLVYRVAQHELAHGDPNSGAHRLRTVITSSDDDELVLRALRSLLQTGLSEAASSEFERELLPLALREPPRAVYRHALFELYALWVPRLSATARGSGAEAAAAQAELSAIGRRAAKPLLAALSDSDQTQVREAVALLEIVGNASLASSLLSLAESASDLDLRRTALRAAAMLGGDELAPRLLALSKANETRLQLAAAWGLARGDSAATSSALSALANHALAAVRSVALLGLARRAASDAYPALLQAATHDKSPIARASAILGMGMCGDARALEPLAAASAQLREPTLAEAATLGLGLLGRRETAPLLAQRVFSSDARVRAAAELGLAALDHPGRLRFEIPPPGDRVELASMMAAASQTLSAAAAPDGIHAWPELRTAASAALRSDDANKLAALEFLARTSHAGFVDSGDPRERNNDLRAALSVELSALRTHPDPALRAVLVQVLAKTGTREADALLVDLAEDSDLGVRSAALFALQARPLAEQSGWAERLSRIALEDRAFWLRQRAVLALARLGSTGATRSLARVLASDAYALVRESAAEALSSRDASLVAPALLSALHDPELRVATSAARALRRSGGVALRRARSEAQLAPAVRALLVR